MDEQQKIELMAMGFNLQIDRIEAGLCGICGKPFDRVIYPDEEAKQFTEKTGICPRCRFFYERIGD